MNEHEIEKALEELMALDEKYQKEMEECSHKSKINCTWTRCNDGKFMPTENGQYLIIDTDGDYDIVHFYKKGSVILSSKKDETRVDIIAETEGFYFFNPYDNGCPTFVNNVLGYIKISELNIFKVGEGK